MEGGEGGKRQRVSELEEGEGQMCSKGWDGASELSKLPLASECL